LDYTLGFTNLLSTSFTTKLELECTMHVDSIVMDKRRSVMETLVALFVWLIISHQAAVLFSHNKPVISNQPASRYFALAGQNVRWFGSLTSHAWLGLGRG
jgi:K+-transporting ATPase A subunit